MNKPILVNRRKVIQGLLATSAFAVTVKLGGCGGPAAQDDDTITAGFIYVGSRDDYGYNQSHAQGKQSLNDIDGLQTVGEANVSETTAVQETMRSMIDLDGASVIFATSFGYFDPHVIDLAEEFPEVQFFHCGGLYEEGVHPENVGSYFGYIDEAQYLAGIVAAHVSETKRLGFIGAKPIPQVLRNINSFTLGARRVDPDITTQVIFTGDWSEPTREAEAANSMADQDIDVLTCHVDSPRVVIETAENRGIYASGYHANQSEIAPEGYLTGAEWDWSTIYRDYIRMIQEGKTLMNGGIPHVVRGGIKSGFVKLSPYGPAVSEQAKEVAEQAKQQLIDGDLVIYDGEIKDNDSNTVIPEGEELGQTAIELEEMDWLVEGVRGSV